MSVPALKRRIFFKSSLIGCVVALAASTAAGAISSDLPGISDVSQISNQGYLVHPDELRELGFSEQDVENQSQKFNSMSAFEKINWYHVSDSQKIQGDKKISLAEHDLSALNQCYSARYPNGKVESFCSFGTQDTYLDWIKYVSPGQHAGRVMFRQYGDNSYHWTLWRKGTGQWFQMPYVTYYGSVQWPIVVKVQRSSYGPVAQENLQ